MSVIHSRRNPYHPAKPVCTFCGDVAYPPFVSWFGNNTCRECGAHNDILVCASCCAGLRKSLVADMVEVDAAAEIRRLGYPDTGLRRTRATAEDEREWARFNAPVAAKGPGTVAAKPESPRGSSAKIAAAESVPGVKERDKLQ